MRILTVAKNSPMTQDLQSGNQHGCDSGMTVIAGVDKREPANQTPTLLRGHAAGNDESCLCYVSLHNTQHMAQNRRTVCQPGGIASDILGSPAWTAQSKARGQARDKRNRDAPPTLPLSVADIHSSRAPDVKLFDK